MSRPRFATIEVSSPEFEVDGLRHVTAYSGALERRADCTLWAPPGVRGPVPLVVLLHGVYGSHWEWAFKAGAHRIAAALIDAGDIVPLALAMPSDGLLDLGSGYVASAGGDAATWVIDEVPVLAAQVVDAVAEDAPLNLGLAGLSMGGFGALLLGARHGARVLAVAGLSSMTAFEQMSLFVGAYDRLGVVAGDHVVAPAVIAHRERLPAIHLVCGTEDLLIEENRALHEDLVTQGIDHEWHEHPGGHDWDFWQTHLPAALRFLSAALVAGRVLRGT